MAADYTRVIVFKVEDQAIKRATDRITRSLEGIEKTLGRIEQKGFGKIAKEADMAAKSIDKLSKSARGWQGFRSELGKNLMTTKGGGRVLSGGLLGAAMGGNWLKNQMGGLKDAANAILHPFSKATEVATVKTGALSAGLTKLSALASAQPVAAAAMAVAYMAFGDQINRVAKQGIVGLLGGLDKLGKKAYDATGLWRPLNYELKETVKLQEQVVRQQNLFKLPGGRITSRNRAFGIRQQGTPIEEEVRMRNRAINQRAAEHREARMIAEGNAPISRASKRAIRLDAEFKNLPTVKAVRQLHAIEKKRLLIHQRNLRATEKLTMMAEAVGMPGSTGFTAAQYGPQSAPLNRMQRWGIGKGANPKGMFASPGGIGGRGKGALQSGMIGGGFPLLFGQSGLASVLGGIGGAAGGALSPGFGFAGSIVATAAAQKIQEMIDFRKAVDKLNVSIRATGGTSVFTAAQVTKFAKSLGMTKDEALNALAAFQQFEASARIALTTVFGSEAIFNMAAGFKDNAYLIGQMNQLSQITSLEQAKTALEVLKTKGLREAEVATIELLIKKQQELTREQTKKTSVGFWDKMNPFRGMFEFGAKRKDGSIGAMSVEELRQARTDKFTKEDFPRLLAEAKERLELQRQFNDQLERMAIIKAPEDELRKLLDPLRQLDSLAKSVGESFSESFKGIVNGSMTAQQALANLFQRTADHFLDMAAQIIAKQIQMKILGIGLNFMTAGNTVPSGSFGSGSGTVGSGFGSAIDTNIGRHIAGHSSIQPMASGGPVSGGSPYIVGEKGPELFVPGSSGNIVPNHEMGGANIVVNVDASGSSVEGDGGQAEQLGSMLAAAVQAEIANQQRPGGLLARR